MKKTISEPSKSIEFIEENSVFSLYVYSKRYIDFQRNLFVFTRILRVRGVSRGGSGVVFGGFWWVIGGLGGFLKVLGGLGVVFGGFKSCLQGFR